MLTRMAPLLTRMARMARFVDSHGSHVDLHDSLARILYTLSYIPQGTL